MSLNRKCNGRFNSDCRPSRVKSWNSNRKYARRRMRRSLHSLWRAILPLCKVLNREKHIGMHQARRIVRKLKIRARA